MVHNPTLTASANVASLRAEADAFAAGRTDDTERWSAADYRHWQGLHVSADDIERAWSMAALVVSASCTCDTSDRYGMCDACNAALGF